MRLHMESVGSAGDEYVAFTFSLCRGSVNQISIKKLL
jgi:hypothetical protein